MSRRTRPPVALHIDWTRCDGRGSCVDLLPTVLTTDDWGYPLARDGAREPRVPAAERRWAEEAVARCPLLALRLVPAPPRASG